MKNFKVVLEIEVSADNHKQAAEILQEWLQDATDQGATDWVYVVQSEYGKKVYSVDLNDNSVTHIKYKPLIR